jgi:hypothetical protein
MTVTSGQRNRPDSIPCNGPRRRRHRQLKSQLKEACSAELHEARQLGLWPEESPVTMREKGRLPVLLAGQ